MGNDHPDAGQSRFWRPSRSAPTRPGNWDHVVRQLASQTILDGISRMALHSKPVCAHAPC